MNPLNDAILLKALDATSSPVTITDARLADNPIVYCNQAFIKLCEYDRSEIIGKNCRFLQTEDTDVSKVREIRDAIKTKHNCSVTILNKTKHGRIFWNDLQISPVFGEDGTITHFIGFQNDISERLEHERVLLLTQKLENEIELDALQSKNLLKFEKNKKAFAHRVHTDLRGPISDMKQRIAHELTKSSTDSDVAQALNEHIKALEDGIDALIESSSLFQEESK